MYFKKIKLVHFRNFEDVTVEFSPRVNVLLGDNGQGKTNILEAIYLVSQSDSFRYVDNQTMISHGQANAFVGAILEQNELLYKLKLQLSRSKKIISINEKKASTSELRKLFCCVVFSPESLSSIKEGSDHRRELIDELLISFDKKNADLISEYRKALKTRNKILKNHFEGLADRNLTIELLNSINPSFVRLARDLTHARLVAIRGLLKDFNNAMQYISQSENVEISVDYVMSGEKALSFDSKEIENTIKNRLSELLDAELSSGVCLVGPHKHDVIFLYDQKDSRFYCSQGQQRAIILSFKMAQIVYHRKVHGVYPLLLLDDVLSELDRTKREALIKFLHEINTQTFITTTDFALPESFQLKEISVVKINNGKIV